MVIDTSFPKSHGRIIQQDFPLLINMTEKCFCSLNATDLAEGKKNPILEKEKRVGINKYMDGMMNSKRCIWRFFTIYFLIFGKQTAADVAELK